MRHLKRIGIDGYMLLLMAMVLAGAVVPVRGIFAQALGQITFWAVALLFFLYGAKLDLASIRAGLMNVRLQVLSFGATYVMFPLLGLAISAIAAPWIGPELALGVLFLSVLPSTIQSSIAFTGMSGGNVAGAICSASISNLVAVVMTPALLTLLLHQHGIVTLDGVMKIAIQILIPFILGQIVRPWARDFIMRHKALTMVVDRGSILLIVYAAFSAGTVSGLWSAIPPQQFAAIAAAIAVFLALVMNLIAFAGRWLGMPPGDRAALFYCGSTKSLASGLPIASALFPPQSLAAIVLPTMLFHLSQLLVCAYIAQRSKKG